MVDLDQTRAKVVVSDKGGVWLSFWTDGGVIYFKDGQSAPPTPP